MVHRSSDKIVMYPVDKQAAQTLIPLIERHVSPGSRIFTDSCAAYLHLNELGYEHLTDVWLYSILFLCY
jgi:transposase-like protein